MPEKANIGIFIGDVDEPYQIRFLSSIETARKLYPVNIYTFAGMLIEALPSSEANSIFHLARNKRLDGIIVLGGIIGNYITSRKLQDFIAFFRAIPLINAGTKLPGIPSIVIDNEKGIEQEVNHLVTVHGCRKIVFIKGLGYDGEMRYKGFLGSLKKHRIPVNAELIIQGNFTFQSGYNGINALLEKKIKFDAVLATNDRMAIGAVKALLDRKIRVPTEVICAGFDNIEEAVYFIPGITTVNQPLDLMAQQSLALLLRIIKNETVEMDTVLPAELILRESCGCISNKCPKINSLEDNITYLAATREPDPEKTILAKTTALVNMPVESKEILDAWLKELVSFILTNLNELDQIRNFDYLYKRIINTPIYLVESSETENFFLDILKACCKNIIQYACSNKETSRTVELIFYKLYMILNELLSRTLKEDVYGVYDSVLRQNITEAEIVSCTTIEDLTAAFMQAIKLYPMKSCYMVLYSGIVQKIDSIHYELPRTSILAIAYDREKGLEKSGKITSFNTLDILPDEYFLNVKDKFFLIFPLVFVKEFYGYIIYEHYNRWYNTFQDRLRRQISYTLKNIYLLDALQQEITGHIKAKHDLQKMTEKAEEANKAKSHFVANVTHELRTPLNSILGYTQLLVEKENDLARKKKLEIISKSGNILLNLINDILDFSKIEAGNISLNTTTFSIHNLLDEIEDMFILKAKEKNIEFSIIKDNTLPAFMIGDITKVSQVCINLLSNAFKFTHKGYIRVECSYKEDYLILVVADTGIGIPADQQQQIFFPFFQTGNVMSKRYEGTGLGLSITKKIVELFAGTIRLKSAENEGTIFTIKLKLPTIPGYNTLADIHTENPAYHLMNLELSDYRILVVDDLKVNLELLEEVFRENHINADFTDNGTDALNLLAENRYDLMLLDILMPVVDGYTVIKAIRCREEFNQLQVIAFTASVMKQDEEKYLSLGFNDFLAKPVDKNLLLHKIYSLIYKKKMEPADNPNEQPVHRVQDEHSIPAFSPAEKIELQKILDELKDYSQYFDTVKINTLTLRLPSIFNNPAIRNWITDFREKLQFITTNFDEAGLLECIKQLEIGLGKAGDGGFEV